MKSPLLFFVSRFRKAISDHLNLPIGCNNLLGKRGLLPAIGLCLLSLNNVFAQTSWKGTTSTSWSNTANWSNGKPTASVDVTIGDASFTGSYQPYISSKASCKSLTLGNATKVSTLTANAKLTVKGTITIGANGTIIHSKGNISTTGNWVKSGVYTATGNNVTVIFAGVTQSLTGAATFKKLTINAGSTTTLGSSITTSKAFTVNGTFDPTDSYLVTLTGATFTVSANATLRVKAATFAANYSTSPSIDRSSTVDYASTTVNQTIANYTYGTLRISGGLVKTLANNTSVSSSSSTSGNVNVAAGTLDLLTYTLNRASTGGGSFTMANGTFLKIANTSATSFPANYTSTNLGTTSTVEYYGANQTVTSKNYGNLILSGSATATKTMPGTAMVVANDFTSQGSAGAPVSFTAGANITVNGHITIGAFTTFNGGSGSFTHTVVGNWTNNGTFTGNASTVTMSGTNRILGGSSNSAFFNLSITGYGITASATNVTVGGNLTASSPGTFVHNTGGTLTMSGTNKSITGTDITLDNLTLSGSISTVSSLVVGGNMAVTGSFSATAGTVNMNGTSKTISNSGSLIFYALRVVGTISTASSFSLRSDFSGIGKLTATAGTLTFIGTSSFTGSHDLFNATLAGTKLQLSTSAVMAIAGAFTLTAGTFDVTTTTPNTVNYNHSGNQNVAATIYNNLSLSTGGTKTLTGATTANNILTIGTGATLAGSSQTLTLYGNWVNNNVFTGGTSTVEFKGDLDASITGATTFNILTINKTSSVNYVTLNNNVSVPTLNMTKGELRTGSNTITITTTRSGPGIITGTIVRTHTYTAGTSYAFESPDNIINLTSITGTVTSIAVTVNSASVDDFPLDGSINRVYNIVVTGTTTYVATLRLHYQDTELNGNAEASMALWRNVTFWSKTGKTTHDVTNNWVEKTGITDINNRWTLSDDNILAVWKGAASSAWTNAANWKTGTVPASTDIVEIGTEAFTNQPTISTTVSAKSMTFGSVQPVILTLSSGGTLSVNGNLRGDWLANAVHTINIGNQTMNLAGDLVLSNGTASRQIDLSIGTGTLNLTGALTQNGSAIIAFSGAGAINLGSDFNYLGGTFTPGSGTFTYNGASSQVVAGGITYNHLTLNKTAGIATMYSAITVNGNLTLSTAGTFNVNASLSVVGNVTINTGTTMNENGETLSVGGNWSRTGTFISSLGNATFNGTGNQTVSATTFNNLTINKSSGTITLANNLSVNSNLTVTAGTLSLATYTLHRSTTGGTFTLGAGATLKVAGAANFPANYNSNTLSATSTVEYTGTVAQTITPVTYGNLVLSNGGATAKTLSSSTTIAGDLTINSNATLNGSAYTLTLQGNFTRSGTFTAATGSVVFAGTSKFITGSTRFNNLIMTGSYSASSGTDLTMDGYTDLAGSYTAGTNGITLYGDLTISGAFSGDGNITYMGTQVQTIRLTGTTTSPSLSSTNNFNGTIAPVLNSTASPTFVNVNINNTGAGGFAPSVDWIVLGTFTVAASAIFDGGSLNHSFYNSFTNNGTVLSDGTLTFSPVPPYNAAATATIALGSGTAFVSTGTVVLGGTRQIILTGSPASFNSITVSNTNAAGITPPAAWNLDGDLTVKTGATLHAGAGLTHVFGRNFSVIGTFDGGTSTINFDPTDSTVISGSGDITFHHLSINGYTVADTDFDVSGNFTNNNVFDPTGAVIAFTGTTSASIGGSTSPTTFETLNINKDAATVTMAVPIDGLLTLQVLGGTFSPASYNLAEESTEGGSLLVDTDGILKITSTMPVFTNGYSFNQGSTVNYAGTTQTVSLQSYSNLTFSNSGVKTFAAGTTYIGGDFTITGTAMGNATTNSAAISFNGTTLQTTPAFTYHTVTIDNTAGVSLGGQATINNSLVFTNGSLLTNAYKVVLSSTAAMSGEATGKYVIGLLETTRNVGIGSSTFGGMGLSIAVGIENLGNVTVVRKAGSGRAISWNSKEGINRSWDITISGTQPASGRSVTFTWLSDDDNGQDISNMKIMRQQTVMSDWEVMTAALNASTRTMTLVTTHFSEWTTTDNSVALPVRLLAFKAARNAQMATELTWTTASEENNHGFDVERSTDAVTFNTIGFVQGAGNSRELLHYSFLDNAFRKAAYYRLRQVDMNGSFEYSAIIYVPAAHESFLLIFPNPVVDKVTLSGNEELMQESNLSVDLLSELGVVMAHNTGALIQINEWLNARLNVTKPGVYFLVVKAPDQNYHQKIVKQ
ncbi:MAG: T9SS type A sorting domain-containing protein [Bacteroidota bacterium]